MRKLTVRETVLELLRTYQEITCTLNGAADWLGGATGSRTLYRDFQKNPYFIGSYRALESILVAMRDTEPALYWAVAETYVRAPTRIIEVKQTRKAKNNKTVTETIRKAVPVVSKAVRPEDLSAGVDWLAAEFTRRGITPFLPTEIWEHAAA